MIGTRIEKYEVLEKIGEGGMATVYRGRHTTLDRQVAIKVMHPHLTSSDKNRARFAREARAIESLRHQNILRIFDYSGPTSEQCFIVTELIAGPTLRFLLDDVGAMMPEPAALVARELCQALTTAHGHGIVHRDLKPENIMLDGLGHVKLMDFGIARIADDSQVTMTGTLVGSPAYMSPEQATGEEVDQRSDIFALGTVMYRMVTGTLPFRGGNPSVVLKNIIDVTFEDPVERVPSLSPKVASIIRKCLGRQPEDRYADTEEIRAELEDFLDSVSIDPDEPGEWALSLYLTDANAYEERLEEYLVERLIQRGRAEADAGRTAEALRTFNRVLTLDEDNGEVVEIISSMRPPLADEPKQASVLLWVAPLLIAVLVFGALAVRTDMFGTATPTTQNGPRLNRIAIAPLPTVNFPEARSVDSLRNPITPEPRAEATPAEITPAVEVTPAEVSTPERATPEPSTPEPVAIVVEGRGWLRVVSGGQFVQVSVDGVDRGLTPFQEPLELDAGDHTVQITGPVHVEQETTTFFVPPDEEVTLTLQPHYRSSTVRFGGFPLGTVVLVNGAPKGTVQGHGPMKLDAFGDYEFVFRNGALILHEQVVTYGTATGDLLPGSETLITFE